MTIPLFQVVRGMNDHFGDVLQMHRHIEQTANKVFSCYGYQEIRTPIVESLDLFVRSVGQETDVVQKEMYLLAGKDKTPLCLRPENTASVVRAVLQHGLLQHNPEAKLWYCGPMFRRERPQQGRLRQFHQVGAEAFGNQEPSLDAELIGMLHHWLHTLGLHSMQLRINSLGTPQQRQQYTQVLQRHYEQHVGKLCAHCQRRLQGNALRVLDCKQPACIQLARTAPSSLEFLDTQSRSHFDEVCRLLKQADIAVHVDSTLVRGLDYYTHTVFEIVSTQGLGAQDAVAAGGRYNDLVQDLGGPQVPALGFAAGIERLALLLQHSESPTHQRQRKGPHVMLVHADAAGRNQVQQLANGLRQQGMRVQFTHSFRSVKAQMRLAHRCNAQHVLVLGQTEVQGGKALLKNMHTKQQQEVSLHVQDIVKQ
ncbi:MAG: histidine--tRNA ligase, partial [Myxococcota bacterium]